MRTRIAAALAGLTLAAGTLVGTAVAVPDKDEDPDATVSAARFSEVICRILEKLDLLDDPALADLVELLGCKDSDDPTKTTSSTTSTSTTTSTTTTTPITTPPAGRGVR